MAGDAYDQPEAGARRLIDDQLTACGWTVQDYKSANLGAGAVAIREMVTSAGPADYVLFLDRRAVGVIEAKKPQTLTGVEWQTNKYATATLHLGKPITTPLPFLYESTGVETHFTNLLDPEPRARHVFTFHRPETLSDILRRWAEEGGAGVATLRQRLQQVPELGDPDGRLWPAQSQAINNLEDSLRHGRPRALIQMATGSGKTFTAANISYRLIRHADAKRILFLVDRSNLGEQTLAEFQSFQTPDDGRKFTELYNIQHLSSNRIDPAARVVISTIQRVWSIIKGDEELDPEVDERSSFDLAPSAPVEAVYRPHLPIEEFDVVIVDECHRSIYGLWRQLLDYFDAFTIGLTATPGKQTFGFFNQNLVQEYDHTRAVADGVNVDFDVFRISTEITEQGAKVDAGLVTHFRDRMTREKRLQLLDEDISYDSVELDRKVVAPDQIRTIIGAFRDNLSVMFPGRTEVPKTLFFAKDDSHADDIVQMLREEFGKGNEFAAKITYKAGSEGQKPKELLQAFRNSYNPRIAITVDMIATGTDVKPLECVVFMRMVRSRNLFEQMKGRGVRVASETDMAVTPDAGVKDRFVLVDAVGVTEADLNDTVPLDRKKTIGFDKLLQKLAYDPEPNLEVVSSIAARIARLERRISQVDRARTTAELRDPRHLLVDAAGGTVGLVVPGRAVEHALSQSAERLGDREELLGVGPGAGHPPAVGHAVGEAARDRVADRAGPEALLDEARHLGELLGRCDEVLVARGLAADVGPDGHVADISGGVDALGHGVDGVEVLAVGLPVPVEPLQDRGGRDVLDRLHHVGERLGLARTERRERHAAVAHDHRRDAVPARRAHERVPTDLGVEMGVEVDEPRRDQPPVRLDDLGGSRRVDVAHGDDAVAVDRDVRPYGRRARAVDHCATPDHQIVSHRATLRPWRLDRWW